MKDLDKASHQLINALFSFLNNLEGVVFWACTPDYKKQLYVNDSYETIWGRPKEELQNNFGVWAQTLVTDDLLKNMNEFKRRMIAPGASSMGFRVARPDNELRYIKNTSFTLYDKDNNPSIILGVDESLNAQHWEQWLTKSDPNAQTPFLNEFISVLQKEGGLQLANPEPEPRPIVLQDNIIYVMNEPVKLTKRECQCLKLALMGKSAKQTAYELDISVRTVEIHIDNVRRKANCRTKYELISKLQYFIV